MDMEKEMSLGFTLITYSIIQYGTVQYVILYYIRENVSSLPNVECVTLRSHDLDKLNQLFLCMEESKMRKMWVNCEYHIL